MRSTHTLYLVFASDAAGAPQPGVMGLKYQIFLYSSMFCHPGRRFRAWEEQMAIAAHHAEERKRSQTILLDKIVR